MDYFAVCSYRVLLFPCKKCQSRVHALGNESYFPDRKLNTSMEKLGIFYFTFLETFRDTGNSLSFDSP